MRTLALFSTIFALSSTVFASPEAVSEPQPYRNVLLRRSANPIFLLKRQSCPSGHSSCSALGDAAACCPNNTVCARDQNGNVACCPTDAVCTGVISGSARSNTGTASTTPFVLGGSTTTTAPPSTTAPATLGPGYSTVPNQYYPFVQIPTSYSDSAACQSAFETCQAASTACFNSLGGQNGVTISGLGTGLTQAGITGTIASSASSICSSLSQQGCYGIQSTVCNQFGGGGTQTTTTGFVQVPNAGPAGAARCTGALYTAAAAAVAGAGIMRIAMV